MLRSVTAKLGNMRKAVEWTVYPIKDGSNEVTIQSAHRIAAFKIDTGYGLLSKHKSNGAYFIDLNGLLGATPVIAPEGLIATILGAAPVSGDEIGPGVYIA